MQILEKEKTNDLWPEITLSSYVEKAPTILVKKRKSEGLVPRNPEIIRLKSKILEYFSGALNEVHSPFSSLRIDLFGEFRFQTDATSPFEEEGLSEREKICSKYSLRNFWKEHLRNIKPIRKCFKYYNPFFCTNKI